MDTSKFSLLIDDKDIESFGISLVGYEVQSYLGRKTTGVDIPGAHGIQSVPSALSSSTLLANVVCNGQNPEETNNRIRRFFAYMYSTDDSHKLVFTDDSEVVRYAILDSPDKHKVIKGLDGAMAEMKLSFHMLDPFTYQSESDKSVNTVGSGASVSIENESYQCPAVYTLENTGASAITGISLNVNDASVTYSCTLNPGDKIVLDTIEYEVRFNGEVRLDYWEGEMPMLKNGTNVISQRNSQSASLLLTVEFTKQWV